MCSKSIASQEFLRIIIFVCTYGYIRPLFAYTALNNVRAGEKKKGGVDLLIYFFRIGRYVLVSLYIRDEAALSSVDVMSQVGEIRTE